MFLCYVYVVYAPINTPAVFWFLMFKTIYIAILDIFFVSAICIFTLMVYLLIWAKKSQ